MVLIKIIIDLLHPAHFHFFSHFIAIMRKKGHKILILSRDKDCLIDLLEEHGFEHRCLSKQKKGMFNLGLELFKRLRKTVKIIKDFEPDLLIGCMGAIIAPAGRLTGVPSYVFYENESAKLTNKYVYRLCSKFITPESYRDKVPKEKHVTYKGYQQLAFLHPNRFIPSPKVLKKLNLKENEVFTIIRFVSWESSHDIGHKGISYDMKIKAIKGFAKYGKVFITSEKPLPKELEEYKLNLPIKDIHHLMYYATLLYGESATMASEAVCLGTYAIYLDNKGRGFTHEQEKKYGLIRNFTESKTDQEASIECGVNILKNKNAKEDARKKSKILIKDNIDVTKFMLKVIINEDRME